MHGFNVSRCIKSCGESIHGTQMIHNTQMVTVGKGNLKIAGVIYSLLSFAIFRENEGALVPGSGRVCTADM